MLYEFVTTADPSQGISGKARSHVMKTYVRRQRTKRFIDLSTSSESNRTRARVSKLSQKVVRTEQVQNDSIERHFTQSTTCQDVGNSFGTGLNSYGSNKQRGNVAALTAGTNHQVQEQNQDIIAMRLYELMASFRGVSPQKCLGSEIDPFHTLPQISASGINIERLKKHCSMYFGSEALGQLWVPTIMKARHSFLSCMCLGASHHDIMSGMQQDSRTTIVLKTTVIQAINEALSFHGPVVTQTTVIAILHLLGSEVVNGSESSIQAHLRGLDLILDRCGGVDALGLDGLIANILSIMVLLAWTLRGCAPPKHFLAPFPYQHRRLDMFEDSIPGSPLYAPDSKMAEIGKNSCCARSTHKLLCDMRDLTCTSINSGLIGPKEVFELSCEHPSSIYARTFALPSALISGHEAGTDWVYEACRLAACLYCSQLHFRPPDLTLLLPAVHELHAALLRSDVSDCWRSMAGVLFWCALVGASCMQEALQQVNSLPSQEQAQYDNKELERHEYCRKWLSLLAVRLSVVLGFEHPAIICITLRRFVIIRDLHPDFRSRSRQE